MKDGKQIYKHCEELAGREKKKSWQSGVGKKYAGGKWSEACLLFIYQSDNRTSCNVKCKKIISRLQTSAMCCNIFVNMRAAAATPSICHACLLCLSRSGLPASLGWLPTSITFSFSWRKETTKPATTIRIMMIMITCRIKRNLRFLSFINLHHQSRARKAKYTLLIYDLVISKKRLKNVKIWIKQKCLSMKFCDEN